MIQVHEEPTDYVWISCLPQDEENDWCYGSMKPVDTEELIEPPRSDISNGDEPVNQSSNGATGMTDSQKEKASKPISEPASSCNITEDPKNNPDSITAAETLDIPDSMLKYMPVLHHELVRKLQDDAGLAGSSCTSGGSGTEEDAADEPLRKRLRTDFNKPTSATKPSSMIGAGASEPPNGKGKKKVVATEDSNNAEDFASVM
jgi:hypothetical protein